MKGSLLAFWDSSALAFLCVNQKASARYLGLSRRFPKKLVWWGSLVEIHSTIARCLRSGELTGQDAEIAGTRLEALRTTWHELQPSEEIKTMAIELLGRQPLALRAADALQLAAALKWCGGKVAGRNLVCDDERLCAAARQVGFTVWSRSRA